MATNTKTIDWGGLTLKVKDLIINAAKPGEAGSPMTTTELAFLDGAVIGVPAAGKVVVANSSGKVPVTRTVIEDGAAVVLTADQTGGLCIFDKTDGALFTLPAPVVGMTFEFNVDVASASVGQKIITNSASVFIGGTVRQQVTATGATTPDVANGTTHRSVNWNGTTTGGLAGTRARLTARSATVWIIEGLAFSSGTLATSFATS